jgi:hypothetical protein
LPQSATLPAFDVQAPLLSLPRLCGTTLATIPADIPYLAADQERVRAWKERLADLAGLKVGICWQGSRSYPNDARRSVTLTQFAPLAEMPGVRLVSLQWGHGSEQLPALADRLPILDVGGPEGFVDMAAVMMNLDLVITVDTALVHLAGALGVPVWVALPFVPDWRWMLEREDSPWYPTARLFRQPGLGNWEAVFLRMQRALRNWCIPASSGFAQLNGRN